MINKPEFLLIFIPTVANGARFGESNASKSTAFIFTHLFPRKSLLLKNKQTSGMT
jgi:hypothetical protein